MLGISSGILRIIQDANQPQTGYLLACVDSRDPPYNDPPYQNYIHQDGKSILCINNCAARDRNQPRWIFWSDVMAACCTKAMEITGGQMRSIETIWRIQIQNDTTQRLIADTANRPRYQQLDLRQYMDIDSSTDDFYALLATDNGKGPARMLAAYPGLFGGKIITRARIFPHGGDPHICWFLEEIETGNLSPTTPSEPGDGPLSRKQRRKQKRKSALT